jgi:hypothetical protein
MYANGKELMGLGFEAQIDNVGSSGRRLQQSMVYIFFDTHLNHFVIVLQLCKRCLFSAFPLHLTADIT